MSVAARQKHSPHVFLLYSYVKIVSNGATNALRQEDLLVQVYTDVG